MKRKDFFELWIKALESGEYKQTKNTLERDGKFCCLGVACDLAIKHKVRNVSLSGELLPEKMSRFLGLDERGEFNSMVDHRDSLFGSLTSLNDSGVKFKTIARIIREQLELGNFRKP